MLATIQEYGLERLAAAGEEAAARQAHAAYFLRLAERAWPAFRHRAGQEPWLDRLEVERANLRAALGWLDESGDAASLLRLAGAFFWFWYIRGPLDEGRSWLERALAGQDADVPDGPRTRAMIGAAVLAHYQGDDDRARTWLEASLAGSEELDDPWLLAFAPCSSRESSQRIMATTNWPRRGSPRRWRSFGQRTISPTPPSPSFTWESSPGARATSRAP